MIVKKAVEEELVLKESHCQIENDFGIVQHGFAQQLQLYTFWPLRISC